MNCLPFNSKMSENRFIYIPVKFVFCKKVTKNEKNCQKSSDIIYGWSLWEITICNFTFPGINLTGWFVSLSVSPTFPEKFLIFLIILMMRYMTERSYRVLCFLPFNNNQASGFNICFYLCNSRVSNGFRRKPDLVFRFMFITDFYETKVPLLQTVLERIFVTSKF